MCAKCARRAAPPHAVDVERQHVVEQVVARSDRGKHLAHRARGRMRVARAFRRSADYTADLLASGTLACGLFPLLLFLARFFYCRRALQLRDNAFDLQQVVGVVPGEHARQVRDAFLCRARACMP